MTNKPVKVPSGFAPAFALGIADEAGNLALIGSQMPLPVVQVAAAPPVAIAPLAGSASANQVAGPFAPVAGVPVMLQLGGTWTGTVQVARSVDGGLTFHSLTVGGLPWARFTANVCEPVWDEAEAGAQLYLDIAVDSGTLTYRVSQ